MKLTRVELNEAGRECDNCGTFIKWLYHLRHEDGIRLIVGSECAGHLAGPETVGNQDKRAKRAARQWRANKPERLPDETREAYIARRLTEMGNALVAHKAYVVAEKRALKKAHVINARAVNLFTLELPARTWACTRWFPWEWWQIRDRYAKRIAHKFNANPFDFTRATWDVKKI